MDNFVFPYFFYGVRTLIFAFGNYPKAHYCRWFRQSFVNLVILFFLNALSLQSIAAPRCGEVLQNSDILSNIASLAQLKLSVEQAKVKGILSTTFTTLQFDYQIKRNELIQLLSDMHIMNLEQFDQRLKQEIIKLQKADSKQVSKEKQERKKQHEVLESYAIDGSTAVFYKIEHGSFEMGEPGDKKVNATITKDFEMMATLTTQTVWQKIAELGSAKLNKNINPRPNRWTVGVLNPIDIVSYENVHTWIEILNELSQGDEPALYDIIRGHKKGAVYRLPTEAEWEFVLRGRGIYDDDYFLKDTSNLRKYAWFNSEDGGALKPVAEKLPIEFEGKRFYDMLGNSNEWVEDYFQAELAGGADPLQTKPNGHRHRVYRGGHAGDNATNLLMRKGASPGSTVSGLSFRLVRELP